MAVIALHNCGKSYSQSFKLQKPLKVSRMYIFQAIKRYEELWWAQSGRLKSSRAEATIKTVWEQIHQNLLWKQDLVPRDEHSNLIDVEHRQGRSTQECTPPLKGTHPYSCCEGSLTDKSRAPPPVARQEQARKHTLHG